MLAYDGSRASRFGVLPKGASSEAAIRWFELPAMYAYHVANAWQEGPKIRVFICVYEDGVHFHCTLHRPRWCKSQSMHALD